MKIHGAHALCSRSCTCLPRISKKTSSCSSEKSRTWLLDQLVSLPLPLLRHHSLPAPVRTPNLSAEVCSASSPRFILLCSLVGSCSCYQACAAQLYSRTQHRACWRHRVIHNEANGEALVYNYMLKQLLFKEKDTHRFTARRGICPWSDADRRQEQGHQSRPQGGICEGRCWRHPRAWRAQCRGRRSRGCPVRQGSR